MANMTFTSRISAEAIEFLADAYINLKLTASDSAVTFSSGPTNEKCLLEGVATCTTDYQAANKTYVDSVAQGLAVKAPVVVTSVDDVDLTTLQKGSTVNGVLLQTGDRILIQKQTQPIDNGIYVIAVNAPPPRAADMATGSHPAGSFCFSESGTLYADAGFVCTSDAAAVVGTNALTFAQFSQAGVIEAGTNLNKVGNVLNLDADISLTSVTTGTLTLASGSITASDDLISFGSAQLSTEAGADLGSLSLSSGSIEDSGGAIEFGSTNLSTAGNVSAFNLTATAGATFGGTLELSAGTINSTTGAINFINNSLFCGYGSIQAGTYNGSFVLLGTTQLGSASITDSSGAISFGSTALTTSATINAKNFIATDNALISTMLLQGGAITDSSGTISFSSTNISTSANVSADTVTAAVSGSFGGALVVASGSITDTSGAISFANATLTTTGLVSADLVRAGTGGTFGGTLAVSAGSITDTSGAISFGSNNIDTSGQVSAVGVKAGSGIFGGTLGITTGSITDTSGAIDFGSTNLATTGDVSGASFTSTSDARLKENIRVLQDPLEKVRGLRGISFEWIETKQADVGVLAQDVQQVLPELVRASDDGVLRVDYPKLTAVLIEAVKLLEQKVLALEARQLV